MGVLLTQTRRGFKFTPLELFVFAFMNWSDVIKLNFHKDELQRHSSTNARSFPRAKFVWNVFFPVNGLQTIIPSNESFTSRSTHGSRTKEIRVNSGGEEDEFLIRWWGTKSLIFKTDVFSHARAGWMLVNQPKMQRKIKTRRSFTFACFWRPQPHSIIPKTAILAHDSQMNSRELSAGSEH